MDAAAAFAKKRAEKTREPITEDEARAIGAIDTPVPEPPPQEKRTQRKLERDVHMPDLHRPLPHSVDAEKGVLGSILLAPMKMYEVERAVGASHFHHPAHALIYKSLQELHADNEPIDLISVTQYLNDQGKLESVGGAAAVTELFTFVPTASNIAYYLEILCEKYRAREVIAICAEASAKAYDAAEDHSTLLDEIEEKARALRSIGGRNGRLPDMDDMSRMTGENRPVPPPELVKGLLHQGSKMIIGGTSKGRKTFGLMDLGISVATGFDWWGCPTVKGKVCYINFEIQKPFFAKRYEDICKMKGATPDPGMFMSWTLRGMVEGMEKMADQLIKSLIQHDFALIIVDPIYKALGDRDENKAGDVASLLNELERIAVRTGAAIAFGAHYSKGNQAAKTSMDRIGGSGVFARDPDAILTMTAHEQDECFTVDATLRNFAPMEPFVLRWEWPLFKREEALNPEDLQKPPATTRGGDGQYKLKYTVDHIIETLRDHGDTGRLPSEVLAIVSKSCGMGKSTFWKLWVDAKASPNLVNRNGRFYHIQALAEAEQDRKEFYSKTR